MDLALTPFSFAQGVAGSDTMNHQHARGAGDGTSAGPPRRSRRRPTQAKYITWLVSWWTVTARAMADGVRSSELPDRCEPSPEHDEW